MAADDERLREAIELAFVVAVLGSRQRPPLAVPAALRPYLRFHKLPPAALGPVRRAVESDDEFRSRVALAATPELAGEAGVLWLQRPEGWEQQLAELVTADEAADQAESDQRAERSAAKRLEAAEHTARLAAAELATLRAQLGAEVSRREQLARAHDKLERRAAQLEVELGGARRRVAEATTRLDAAHEVDDEQLASAIAAAVAGERAQADVVHQAQLASLQAELDGWRQRALRSIEDADAVAQASARPSGTGEALAAPMPALSFDIGRLAAALADAGKAADSLGRALADAGSVVEGTTVSTDASPVGGVAAAAGVARVGSRQRDRRAGRVALALPGGVLADSVEAALHLLRAPGALVIVDGYNVAKLAWPDHPLAEQRRRLLDAIDEVVARHGTRVQVVFDAAAVDPAGRHTPRRLARVTFSPAGVVADDVIVDLVADQPTAQTVVVVSNDNDLRGRVRKLGANLLGSEQLLSAARRAV